jgi:hypothetical protein
MSLNKPSPDWRLRDLLLEIDEARNASPKVPQQASAMVKERDAKLAREAEKIAALRRARESAGNLQLLLGECMPRKRELIDTGTDKRYVRRNERGTSFVESDDVGRSLAADRRQRAETKVKSGEGDKGDRPRAKTKRKAAKKTSRETASRKGVARKSPLKERTNRRR